jgi:hypothetical protein
MLGDNGNEVPESTVKLTMTAPSKKVIVSECMKIP